MLCRDFPISRMVAFANKWRPIVPIVRQQIVVEIVAEINKPNDKLSLEVARELFHQKHFLDHVIPRCTNSFDGRSGLASPERCAGVHSVTESIRITKNDHAAVRNGRSIGPTL